MNTLPVVGLSRPPIMLKSVDFPEPDGPMMDRYSPASMVRSTPLRAWTSILPMRKARVTPTTRTMEWEVFIGSVLRFHDVDRFHPGGQSGRVEHAEHAQETA